MNEQIRYALTDAAR